MDRYASNQQYGRGAPPRRSARSLNEDPHPMHQSPLDSYPPARDDDYGHYNGGGGHDYPPERMGRSMYDDDRYYQSGPPPHEEDPYYAPPPQQHRYGRREMPPRQPSYRERAPTLGIERQGSVDRVYHDSPSGPAVSIYPSRAFPNEESRVRAAESRWRAEEAKLAGYRSEKAAPPAQPAPQGPNTPMIEISPGVHVRLRGAAETRDCVSRDFIVPAQCFACDLEMFSIQDAEYVLCPQCRVVNPLAAADDNSTNYNGGGWSGGVALGFTMEVLHSLQQEIIAQERQGGMPVRHGGI